MNNLTTTIQTNQFDLTLVSLDLIFEFDPEDAEQKEALFKLKLKIFEQDEVKKSRKKKAKTDIRQAATPIAAIVAYHSFLK